LLRVFRKTVFIMLAVCCVTTFVEAAVFTDVSDSHSNAAAIDYLSKEGVIGGYPDGSFRPQDSVNRAEALKILLLASGVEIQEPSQNVFADVLQGEWFAPFVFSAKQNLIVDGYPDGSFRPAQTVNLVEALKMLLQTNSVILENYETEEKLFSDSEKNAWYNAFLFYAKTFELVEADSADQIFPATPLTRAQLAEIVFRFQTRVESVCPQFLENAKTIQTNYFREITLENELPNIFYENEIFALRGVVANPTESVLAVVENRKNKNQEHFTAKTENQNFTIPVEFHAPGSYNFTVIPTTANSNSAVMVEVLPRECSPAIVVSSGLPPVNIQTSLIENSPTVSWDSSENNIFRVVLRQNENRFERLVSADQNSLTLDPVDFKNFTEGEATLQIFGAKAEKGWSFEPRSEWFGSQISPLLLSQHHFSELDEGGLVLSSPPIYRSPQISFTGTAKTDIEATAYLITPRGKVEEISILENTEKISAGTQFALDLQLPEIGTYILEINATNGIAVFNHPIYLPSEFPLLPDFVDLRESPDNDLRFSPNREKLIWLRAVNSFRAQQQLSKVSLDLELSNFAQNYAEQMAVEGFFGHVDSAGNNPDVRRKIFGLQLPVGENLARDYKTNYAHAGLLRSAAHRANILTPEWRRVGLGIAKDSEGRILFVQEFSVDPFLSENLIGSRAELLGLINSIRMERGSPAFISDGQIELAAQSWSEEMVADDFLDFTYVDSSLEGSIRATGYSGSFTTFIASANKLSQIVEVLNDEVFTEAGKTRLAIGLAQDTDGMFRATLVFR